MLFAAGVASISSFTVRAQEGTPRICELHAWPSGQLNSVYTGWFHGGIVNGAVNRREGYPEVPPDPLGSARQVALLEGAALPMLLNRASYRLVVHSEPLTSREIRTASGRLSTARIGCYAELIVDGVFLQQDVVNGAYLKGSFRFRDFGESDTPADTPVRVFGSWVQTHLAAFPPKDPAGLSAAGREIEDAYQQNLKLFVAALHKPVKTKR